MSNLTIEIKAKDDTPLNNLNVNLLNIYCPSHSLIIRHLTYSNDIKQRKSIMILARKRHLDKLVKEYSYTKTDFVQSFLISIKLNLNDLIYIHKYEKRYEFISYK